MCRGYAVWFVGGSFPDFFIVVESDSKINCSGWDCARYEICAQLRIGLWEYRNLLTFFSMNCIEFKLLTSFRIGEHCTVDRTLMKVLERQTERRQSVRRPKLCPVTN
jgi:hypothetical protein